MYMPLPHLVMKWNSFCTMSLIPCLALSAAAAIQSYHVLKISKDYGYRICKKCTDRYNTFCKSLSNLAKSKTAVPMSKFALAMASMSFRLSCALRRIIRLHSKNYSLLVTPYKVPPIAVAKSLRLLRDEGSFSISETVIVIWGRCFWLFCCPRWQKKETEWISPLDFSDFTVCFCPFHFWCSIASYSRTFFHLKLLKYQICCSTCAPN